MHNYTVRVQHTQRAHGTHARPCAAPVTLGLAPSDFIFHYEFNSAYGFSNGGRNRLESSKPNCGTIHHLLQIRVFNPFQTLIRPESYFDHNFLVLSPVLTNHILLESSQNDLSNDILHIFSDVLDQKI